jgi:hypothetical protein
VQVILPVVPTLVVSTIYCLWQAYERERLRQRERVLRERVTYMLWVMARAVD